MLAHFMGVPVPLRCSTVGAASCRDKPFRKLWRLSRLEAAPTNEGISALFRYSSPSQLPHQWGVKIKRVESFLGLFFPIAEIYRTYHLGARSTPGSGFGQPLA